MKSSTIRLAAAAVVSSGAVVLATRTGEPATAPSRGPLVMTSFVQNGRTDVHRNEVLEFKFSVRVRRGSADDRTIRVTATTGTGSKPAVVARVVRGNLV